MSDEGVELIGEEEKPGRFSLPLKKKRILIAGLGIAAALIIVIVVVTRRYASSSDSKSATFPLIINTWNFPEANSAAWSELTSGGNPLSAVVEGCSYCEVTGCGGSVGYGGSPDENGETTLDALIMDGNTFKVGSVCALRNVTSAIKVAKAIMDYTSHTMLCGSQATDFAAMMGFTQQSLSTPNSQQMHQDWVNANCQPNYRVDVTPNPQQNCGPYTPNGNSLSRQTTSQPPSSTSTVGPGNHDTISMIVIDKNLHVAAGTSTNGKTYKVPGRVGDGPIMGSGSYADSKVGGCGATGDGDVLMRFLPCVLTLEFMRIGMSPTAACQAALNRIVPYFPTFAGSLIAANIKGEYGAASYGWNFQYTIQTGDMTELQIISVPPYRTSPSN